MAANGNLIFQDTNKATFVGANSNVVIDTVNASFGVGVDVNGPTSNLHVVGNAYVSTDLTASTLSGNGSGLTALNAANVTTGTLDRNTTGSAATLTTPRTIGGVNFDGSADIVPTTFGAATFDTDTLVVDSVNNRVGIGTTSVDSGFKLQVDGNIKAQAVNCSGSGPVITCTASNPGDMISKRYASADRYGMGQYAGGVTRLFTSTAYSSAKIALSGATDDVTGSAAAFTDYLTVVASSGNVGIGTTIPIGKLNIYQGPNITFGGTAATLNDPSPGLVMSSDSAKWALLINQSDDLIFTSHGSLSGTYTGVTGYISEGAYDQRMNDFTGQHRCFLRGIPRESIKDKVGLIVSSDRNKYTMISGDIITGQNAIDISESIPDVSISQKTRDKACFGVISDVEDPDKREDLYGVFGTPFPKEKGDDRVYINSLGEGAIWVANTNGSLEAGDYITTSNVTGYGQRQDSEFLANYTVAKITMDCDFDPVTQPIQIIRKETSNVNYWVKTTYENVSEEDYSNLEDENRQIIDGVYQKITKEESKTEQEGYELEVRQELVNVLDEHGQLQWEDHPTETEKAYKIRYLDADGNITDEANAVHKAAFVGCTYHCG